MALVLRGEIRWADLSPGRGHEQEGRRPVLVLSRDIFNERSGTAIVMAVTSREQKAGFPLTFEIHAAGLPKRSWVKMGQVRTLAVERLGKRLGRLAPEDLAQVIAGLDEIIGD